MRDTQRELDARRSYQIQSCIYAGLMGVWLKWWAIPVVIVVVLTGHVGSDIWRKLARPRLTK